MGSGLLALVLGPPSGRGLGGRVQHKLALQPAFCLAISLWEMEQVVAAVGRVAHPSAPGPKAHEVKGSAC